MLLCGLVLCIIIILIKVCKYIPVSISGDSLCLNNILKTLKNKYYFKLNKDFGLSFLCIIKKHIVIIIPIVVLFHSFDYLFVDDHTIQ